MVLKTKGKSKDMDSRLKISGMTAGEVIPECLYYPLFVTPEWFYHPLFVTPAIFKPFLACP